MIDEYAIEFIVDVSATRPSEIEPTLGLIATAASPGSYIPESELLEWKFEAEPPEWLFKLKQHQPCLLQTNWRNVFHPNLTS
jgi:hypothetical protein